jgi:predicted transcriptional regulator
MAIVVDVRAKYGDALKSLERVEKLVARVNSMKTGFASANVEASKLANTLERAAAAADRIAASVGRAGGRLSAQAQRIANGPAAGPRASSGAAAGGALPPQYRAVSRAQAQLQAARASGDPQAIAIAQNNLLAAQNRASKAAQVKAPPLQGQAAAIASSRVAIGPNGQLQLMPLVNKLMSSGMLGRNPSFGGILNLASGSIPGIVQAAGGIAGGAGAAGVAALGGPVGLAVAGLGAFTMAVRAASDSLSHLTDIRVAGGGSDATIGAAARLEAIMGLPPGKLAEIGKSLGEGYGPMVAGQIGVSPYGGPFGNNNYNEKGLRTAEWVARARTPDQARRRAEMAGAPELARAFLLPEDLKARGGRQANLGYEKANVELQARIQSSLDRIAEITERTLAPVMKVANAFLVQIERILAIIDGIQKWLDERFGALFPGGGRQDAIKENTNAVKENTNAIREGQYGGGSRTGNSWPSRLNPATQPNFGAVPYGAL